MADDPATLLEQIQERWDKVEHVVYKPEIVPEFPGWPNPLYDPPRFLKAVKAVLKLADEAEEVRDYSGPERNGRLTGWNLSPAKVREAITRELAGEEIADGQ